MEFLHHQQIEYLQDKINATPEGIERTMLINILTSVKESAGHIYSAGEMHVVEMSEERFQLYWQAVIYNDAQLEKETPKPESKEQNTPVIKSLPLK